MIWINYLLPFIGMSLCVYVLFTKRICTNSKTKITRICLWIAVWLCLLWAGVFGGFIPVAFTTVARSLALAINLLDIADAFKSKQTTKRSKSCDLI